MGVQWEYERAEAALLQAREYHLERAKLPGPNSWKRLFVNPDDPDEMSRIDEQRSNLEARTDECLVEAVGYVNSILDEIAARGIDRERVKRQFLQNLGDAASVIRAVAVLRDMVRLLDLHEEMRAELDRQRAQTSDEVRDIASKYGLDGNAILRHWRG